jgi:hypothetical protein
LRNKSVTAMTIRFSRFVEIIGATSAIFRYSIDFLSLEKEIHFTTVSLRFSLVPFY